MERQALRKQVFQFKQFSVAQENCAMKVGVDSVLLGSWCELPKNGFALDIGTGTGLLALMLAQRSNSLNISAVEIDDFAAAQAQENIDESSWKERITIKQADIKKMLFDESSFDLIVSNPPYFAINRRNLVTPRNEAREERSLDILWILKNAKKWLSPKGKINLVYPFDDFERVANDVSANDLYITRLCKVFGKKELSIPKRVLLEIGKEKSNPELSSISIRVDGEYSIEYKEITRDFYLDLK